MDVQVSNQQESEVDFLTSQQVRQGRGPAWGSACPLPYPEDVSGKRGEEQVLGGGEGPIPDDRLIVHLHDAVGVAAAGAARHKGRAGLTGGQRQVGRASERPGAPRQLSPRGPQGTDDQV